MGTAAKAKQLEAGSAPAPIAGYWQLPLAPGLLLALATTGAAFVLRLLLDPWLGERGPLLIFTLPVLACALYAGTRAAAAAALLSALVGFAPFVAKGAPEVGDFVYTGLYLIVSGGIVLLGDRFRRASAVAASGGVKAEAESQRAMIAAAELERRERHLKSILDTVPDAMIVIDEQGRIRSLSTAAETMFGYAEAELRGENVSTLMPSPDRERHDSYLARYLRSGERRIIGIGRVTTARRRDGTTFPIDLHVGETRVGEERVFTGFIHDLTERRQAETKLHDLQSQLAHVSRVSAMGTLATALAHELNQPLTAIANYAETANALLKTPSTENIAVVREALADCTAQSMRAGQVVRRLREFIARGETEMRVESLAKLVGESTALALIGAGEQGVELEIKLDDAADAVLVERVQIQQVILNLVRNAVEAMAARPVRQLQISSARRDDGLVQVTIADSGPGLPAKVSQELFQAFVSTKPAGMGVGLSICHTIVTGHGGQIWAEPSALGGAAFHFTLVDVRNASGD